MLWFLKKILHNHALQSAGHKNNNWGFQNAAIPPFDLYILTSLLVLLFIPLSDFATAKKNIKRSIRTLKSARELDYPPFCLAKKDGSADGSQLIS